MRGRAAERTDEQSPASGRTGVEPIAAGPEVGTPSIPEPLDAAAAAAAARWSGESSTGPEEARALLAELARSIGQGLPITSRLEFAEQRRLIELLRQELVRAWTAALEPPTAERMIELLGRLESGLAALPSPQRAGQPAPVDTVEFLSGVAHDLRSPLTSILFLAETLHSGQSGEVNDVQRRQLGIIYSAALGLVSVASDIIEFVRGGTGLTERRPVLFSVTETLESVRDILRPLAEEKGLRVHLFPPAVDQRVGYPLTLSRVLLNLAANGLKFTETGFVEVSVRAMGDNRVEFSVRDTGKGYSPEAITDLYEPFRRSASGARYGFSGTGLGLSIARKLVAAMGSRLEVESRPSWGTRFYFEIELPAGART